MADNNDFFDFDGYIEDDGNTVEFQLLPAGEYKFNVQKVNKDFYKAGPNSKIADQTPFVELELIISSDDGSLANYVRTRIFLSSAFEWKISSFFRAIGMKKHGEKVRMNWDGSVGKTGRCTVTVREYTNKHGETKQVNDVASFLDVEVSAPAPKKMVMGEL